jgi:phospholipid/cholesterol/gamma-HCH transport system substrate-binding protein
MRGLTARRLAPAALCVVAAVTAWLLLTGGPATRTVTATFTGVRGLVDGADVRAGGVSVGRVDRVWLDAAGRPRVRMSVRRDYALRRGATAAVRLGSLSGEFNRYVSLTRGGGPSLGDGAVTLPASATRSPVEVDQAIAALTPATRADVHAALRGLRDGLDGTGPAVAQTLKRSADALRQTALLIGDVNADGAALKSLLADSRRITTALATGRPERLATLVDDLGATLHTTAGQATALRRTVRGLPGALHEPRRALAAVRTAIPDLRAVLRDAAPGLHELVPAAGELRTALSAAAPALTQVAALTRTGPADLRALRPLLDDARTVAGQLTPVLRRAGPMLDQARVRLPDFFSFFANWADFTSNYDANGHGARVGLVLPPASTKVLDPSGYVAGQLKEPYLRTPGALAGVPWKDYADSFVAGGTAQPDVAPSGKDGAK